MLFFWLKKFVSHWLMPLSFCPVLIVVGVVLQRWPAWARLGRWLILGATALLMLLGNRIVSRGLMRSLETTYAAIPADPTRLGQRLADIRYIVVLGGGNGHSPDVSATSLLSSSALARITEAVRLARELPGTKLILHGPGIEGLPSHAEILSRAAQSLGIAPERIVTSVEVHDTEDELEATRRIAGTAPIAIVTSAWHMKRAMGLAHGLGLKVTAAPCDYRTHANDPFYFDDVLWQVNDLERSTVAIRERIGYLWIALRGKS